LSSAGTNADRSQTPCRIDDRHRFGFRRPCWAGIFDLPGKTLATGRAPINAEAIVCATTNLNLESYRRRNAPPIFREAQ